MDAHLISERLNQTADQRDLARQLIRMVEAAPLRIRDYVLSIVYSLISFVRIPDESFFLGLLRRLSLLDVDSLGESVPAWAEALRIILRPTRDQTQM